MATMPRICSLCGGRLTKYEDTNELYRWATGDPTYPHQHLMPVWDSDQTLLCPGTLSLNKYLADDPSQNQDREDWSEHLERTVPFAYSVILLFRDQP